MNTFLLAFDTSSPIGGLALWQDGTSLQTLRLDAGMRHGQLLLPAVDQLLKQASIGVRDLGAIAVGVGPGSYTGTRIGVMAAKSLSYGAEIPLFGVSSLGALAWTAHQVTHAASVVPVMDARRDEVYTARYGFAPSGLPVMEHPDCALTPEEAVRLATDRSLLAGSALTKYPEIFSAALCRADCDSPSGDGVAALGWQALTTGVCPTPAIDLQPTYMRRDDAPCTFERFTTPESTS